MARPRSAYFWVVLCLLSAPLPAGAASSSRPFWTEKTAYVEGEDLFVVGIATKARTPEEGRQQAFERGKVELMNFAQVTDLEAQGLVIETQMTYEEANPDGSVNVFRLLRVPVTRLRAIQGHLQIKGQDQLRALDQSRQELLAVQQSLSQRQQELETRSRDIQARLAEVTKLQASLSEKAQKIEQQQRQVERLLQQLGSKETRPGTAHETGPTLERLKQVEAQLDQREQELEEVAARITERMRATARKACKFVRLGMNQADLRTILGEPDGRSILQWSYGGVTLHFSLAFVVDRIEGCGRQ